MKKISKVAFLSLFVMVAMTCPHFLFAQDSTGTGSGGNTDIFEIILNALSAKWPIVATIGTILFFISEVLGKSKSIAANGVFELIAKVLKNVFGKKS